MILASNPKAALRDRDCGILRQTPTNSDASFCRSYAIWTILSLPQILACSGVADVRPKSIAVHSMVPQLLCLKKYPNTPNPEATPSQDEGFGLLRDE